MLRGQARQIGLMRTAAKELAPRRIRVNTLHPGPASTAFQDDIEMPMTGQPRDEAASTIDAMVPLGRHSAPEEIARTLLYLASDDSAMMTSNTFAIDAASHADPMTRWAARRRSGLLGV